MSRNQLIATFKSMGKAELDGSLGLLDKLRIIERGGEKRHYQIMPQGAAKRDFLSLNLQKKVRVSSQGHRSVSLRGLLMALRDGVSERKCGSFVWREEMPAPKYSLLQPKRWNPLDENNHGLAKFDVEKRTKNDLVFKLKFEPSLVAGDLVSYGFYIWNKNHYSRTRREALERYKDEWIREGLAILDPAIQIRVLIELPDRYEYQRAVTEKDPVLTLGGPNVSGVELFEFEGSRKSLDFKLQYPAPGHYFVSWIPPD